MSNTLCKGILYSRYSTGTTLVHEGTMGMHWGYRYHQPYSSGYQAQEKGIFLGQLASKLKKPNQSAGSTIHRIAKDGTTYSTKKSLKDALRESYDAIKSKFDAWNKIDRSKELDEIESLSNRSRRHNTMLNSYRVKSDAAEARARLTGSDTDWDIVSKIESIRDVYRARMHADTARENELRKKAEITTKTQLFKKKLSDVLNPIGEAGDRFLKSSSELLFSDLKDIKGVKSVQEARKAARRLEKEQHKKHLEQDAAVLDNYQKMAKTNVGNILQEIGLLTRQQATVSISELHRMLKRNAGVAKDSDPRHMAERQIVEQRRERGLASAGMRTLDTISDLLKGPGSRGKVSDTLVETLINRDVSNGLNKQKSSDSSANLRDIGSSVLKKITDNMHYTKIESLHPNFDSWDLDTQKGMNYYYNR